MKMLIVDDTDTDRTALKSSLSGLGHEVLVADSAQKALATYREEGTSLDLILLAAVMQQDVDGYHIAYHLRQAQSETGDEWIPVLLLGERADADELSAVVDAGGDDCLAKPVDVALLDAKLRAWQRVTEMRRRLVEMKDELTVQSTKDELTHLYNRRELFRLLDREIARAQRHHSQLSLAMMDVDAFKQINSQYGHDAGDEVLKTVAASLGVHPRQEDFVARLGSGEFCICFADIGVANAEDACERYRGVIEQNPVLFEADAIALTASFGVSELRPDRDDRESLLKRADAALQRAKEAGGNQVMVVAE